MGYILHNDEFCSQKEWQTKCRELHKEKQITKAEAIKEFAERLKRECIINRGYNILQEGEIDNLVKEMTEEIEINQRKEDEGK